MNFINKEMHQIKKSVFIKSSSRLSECPETSLKEVAFIGRSNVGKSSLINMLTERKSLAKISSKPGKTRLINHFEINESWLLVDLPGYGWAKVSKTEKAKWEPMVSDYLLKRENLSMVFVLADSRHTPQASDLSMIQFLGENGIPVGVIFTKLDKSGNNLSSQNIKKFKRILKENWEELPPIFMTSATTGRGQKELIAFIEEFWA